MGGAGERAPPPPARSRVWLLERLHPHNSGGLPALPELPLTKFGFAFYLELPPVAAERRENLPHKEAWVRRGSDGGSPGVHVAPLEQKTHGRCRGTGPRLPYFPE